MRNELVLTTRWGLVAIIVGIVIVGRFLLTTVIWPTLRARKPMRDKPAPTAAQIARRSALAKWFPSTSLVFLFLYPAIVVSLSASRAR